MRERGLGEKGHGFVEDGQCINVLDGLHATDRTRGNRHGADRFFMSLVTDVDDSVALVCADLDFVVDLCDERTHRVDHVTATTLCLFDDGGWRTVCRQHDGATFGHFGEVVDKNDAALFEAIDDDSVVDYLVVAVHGWFERTNQPAESLDRHLDTRTKAPRRREEHFVDVGLAGCHVVLGWVSDTNVNVTSLAQR